MTPSICHTLNTTQRDQLEQVLVSGVAIELAKDPSKAKSLAEGIKSFLDALHPQPVLYNPHTGAARDQRDVASAHAYQQRIEAAKASGQYAAQLAAGAMSELHVSASVMPADVEANIASEVYFTAADGFRLRWMTEDHPEHNTRASVYDIASNVNVRSYASTCASIDAVAGTPQSLGLLTFCVLVLRNGTKVVGINHGAIDPAQHSAERGRQKARTQAVDKLRELEGYVLRSKLAAN